MISLTIRAEDFRRFARSILNIPNGLDVVSRDVAQTLRSIVIGKTPVDTSELKRSWSPLTQVAGGFSFGTDKPYAIVLEEGLYKSVGPRTVQQGGGIYSRQAPGGMIGPTLEDELLIQKITERVIAELSKGIDDAARETGSGNLA